MLCVTCCAVESSRQLSRDLQHPHILKGKQSVNNGYYRVQLTKKTLIVGFTPSPSLEQQTLSSSQLSLCSSCEIPDMDTQRHCQFVPQRSELFLGTGPLIYSRHTYSRVAPPRPKGHAAPRVQQVQFLSGRLQLSGPCDSISLI